MKNKFDNVWDVLEDDLIKAANLKLRSTLLMNIVAKLGEVASSQTEAATILQTTQPRVSALKQGKINEFRIDMLVDFALRLGLDVSIKVAA